jgi:hypothetical protein
MVKHFLFQIIKKKFNKAGSLNHSFAGKTIGQKQYNAAIGKGIFYLHGKPWIQHLGKSQSKL